MCIKCHTIKILATDVANCWRLLKIRCRSIVQIVPISRFTDVNAVEHSPVHIIAQYVNFKDHNTFCFTRLETKKIILRNPKIQKKIHKNSTCELLMGDKKEKQHYVLAITKVLPDDIETDLDALREKIVEVLKPLNTILEASRIEPIAYGLSALIVRLVIPEETVGGTQPIEDAIESLEEVQRVEVTMVTRV